MKFESNGVITVETIHHPVDYVITVRGAEDVLCLNEQEARLLAGRLRDAFNYENPTSTAA